MKMNWIIVRTIAALAVIFASGVWVGHSFSPRETVEIVLPERPGLPGDGGRKRVLDPVERRIIMTYRNRLSLSQEQFDEFMVLFEQQRKVVQGLPRGHNKERMEKIREMHDQFRPMLSEEQSKALDEMMVDIEAKSLR